MPINRRESDGSWSTVTPRDSDGNEVTVKRKQADGSWQTVHAPDTGGDGPEVLEDFEDGLSAYSGETGQFTTTTSQVYEGAQALETVSSGWYDQTMARDDITVSQGDTLQFRFASDPGNDNSNAGIGLMFGVQPDGQYAASNITGYEFWIGRVDCSMGIWEDSGWTSLAVSDTYGSQFTDDAWLLGELDWGTDGTLTGTVYDTDGETEIMSISPTDTTFSSGCIGWNAYHQVFYADELTRE